MTRRESQAAAPVVIGTCAGCEEHMDGKLRTPFGQPGGIAKPVRGKTVTLKQNLTGSPVGSGTGAVVPWVRPCP